MSTFILNARLFQNNDVRSNIVLCLFEASLHIYTRNFHVARIIAQKHSEAVDFPKTGKAPSPLTTSWDTIMYA